MTKQRKTISPSCACEEEITARYLATFHRSSIATLTQEEKQKLIVNAIADFQDEKICLDALSSIGFAIWDSLDDKLSDLATATDACTEVSFYLRRVTDSKEALQQFGQYMWTILTYYNGYRGILNKSSKASFR